MILTEKELSFSFPEDISTCRFDEDDKASPNYHDLEHMPKVDFIIETKDNIYFIEIKDPSCSSPSDPEGINQKIQTGKLAHSLLNKYQYTFTFRWAEGKLEKSVIYLCLITLESPQLATIQAQLDEKFKWLTQKPSKRWIRQPLQACIVLNLETWLAVFPSWQVSRVIIPHPGA